jgi:hypothetical protein
MMPSLFGIGGGLLEKITDELAENSVGSILEHIAVDGKAYGMKCDTRSFG